MSVAVAAATPPTEAPAVGCPYRGLLPFSKNDSRYFFGRDADRKIIVANLIASPLTLFYAPSGVGKTSVLLAGVYPDVMSLSRDEESPPEYVPVIVRRWSGDALRAIDDAVGAAAKVVAPGPMAERPRLADRLEEWASRTHATLLLILDQFEEFLLYHGDAWATGDAARELAQVLAARDLPVSVLLGLREDALAGLDRFKGHVPHLFDNCLRLEHLDVDAGRRAILGPVEQWNRDHPDETWELDPALVDTVLDEVAIGQVTFGRTGAGSPGGATSRHVEAPFLQLVLTRVWEEERAKGSRSMRLDTLRRLGGAKRILQTHLDDQMRRLSRHDRNMAAAVFRHLVTPSGMKVSPSLADLAQYTGVRADRVARMLDTISGGDWRIVRRLEEPGGSRAARYELFHDVLAEAVLDWQARHQDRRRRRRLLKFAFICMLVTAVAIAAVVIFDRKADEARVGELAADARALMGGGDPIDAVKKAVEAVQVRDTDAAVSTLRAALARSDPQHALPGGHGRVASFRVSADGRRAAVVGSDGRVRVWSLPHPASPLELRAADVSSVAFSPGGDMLATAGSGGIGIWRVADGRLLDKLGKDSDSPDIVRWAPTGDHLLTRDRGRAKLWDRDSRQSRSRGRAAVVRWSPGGTRFATATKRGLVRVWGVSGRRHRASVAGRGSVAALGFTTDGSKAVVARRDGTVNVLGARGCGPRKGESVDVTDAAFAADGRSVAFATASGVLALDLSSCKWTPVLPTPPKAPPIAIHVSSDGLTVAATGSDRAVRVWDVPSQTLLTTLLGDWRKHARVIVRSARDGGEVVLVADDDGSLREWLVTAVPVVRLEPPAHAAEFQAASPSSVVAATARHVIRADGGGEPRRLAPLGGAREATFHADGTRVAVVTDRGELGVLSVNDRERLFRKRDAGHDATSLALDRRGRRLVTAHRDGVPRVWDIGTGAGTTLPDPSVAADKVKPYAVFWGDEHIVVIDEDLYRYELSSRRHEVLAGWKPPRDALVAATRRDLLAATTADTVAVWKAGSRDREVKLNGARRVSAMAFDADGKVLATAGRDGLRLWDAESGEALITLVAQPFDDVAFSEDGRWIVASDGRAGAAVFPCRPCGAVETLLMTAEHLIGDERLVQLARLPTPTEDAPLKPTTTDRSDAESARDGGFAAPIVDRSGAPAVDERGAPETQRLRLARVPTPEGTDVDAVVPTATPQAEPEPVVTADPEPVSDATLPGED